MMMIVMTDGREGRISTRSGAHGITRPCNLSAVAAMERGGLVGVMDRENEGESARTVSKEEKQPFFTGGSLLETNGRQVSTNAKSHDLLLPCLCGVLWREEA